VGTKYGSTMPPSPSPAAAGRGDVGSASGDEDGGRRGARLQRRNLALRRRARAPGRRNRRWSPAEAVDGERGLRVAAM
jgi:hypothetical protein